MSTINESEPAFPTTLYSRDSTGEFAPREQYSGMSLLDWFAGQALAGYCGDGIPGSHHRPEETARSAYDYAEAMLAERERRMKGVPA